MRLIELLEDDNKQLSMHRLGMLLGILVATIVTIGAAILYFFYTLDASTFNDIWHSFLGVSGGGYSLGKITDAFGKETTDVVEDAK